MSNKTYNNIVNLLCFIATIGFVIIKIIDLKPASDKSWWFVVVPYIIAVLFHKDEDDDNYDDNIDNYNNYKTV